MTIEIAITLAALVGLFFGGIIGTALGIKDEAKKSQRKWEDLINRAMRDAYNAGFADGKGKGTKRPSGNK
mgnify:CR=1 FL=1